MTMLVVDGTNIAHRALHAESSDPPAVIFERIVTAAARRQQASEIVVCWDCVGPTWRHRVWPDYKKGSQAGVRPVNLVVAQVLAALPHWGWNSVQVPGWEADDLIATVCHSQTSTTILSSDRDVWQLVRERCSVMAHRKGGVEVIDENRVEQLTGVKPRQYPEVAALRGDRVDNLPGVPGIGPQTAAALVNRYGSVAGVYSQIRDLPPDQAAALTEARQQVAINLVLSRLSRPVGRSALRPDVA